MTNDITVYQDERASQIVEEIWQSLYEPDRLLQEHLVYGTLPIAEAFMRLAMPAASEAIERKRGEAYRQKVAQLQYKALSQRISSIIWVPHHFCNKSITIPVYQTDLLPIPGDKEILMQSKNRIVTWLRQFYPAFKIWECHYNGVLADSTTKEYDWEQFLEVANRVDWIELAVEDYVTTCYQVDEDNVARGKGFDISVLRLHAILNWGMPGHTDHLEHHPVSGCISLQFSSEPCF